MADRVALVVGASSGIGRATAVKLARRGTTVVAAARREDRLRDLSREEPNITYVVGSIDSRESCAALFERAERGHERIDILVNTAAIGAAHETEVLETPGELWRHTMSLNLDAPFTLLQLAGRGMASRGWGRIVFVSSTAGERGGPRMPAYTASKHGLAGLVRAAAIDLAPHGVTCNAVAPGWVKTEMSQKLVDTMAGDRGITTTEMWAEIAATYPSGRLATEDEVAHAIVSLVDDDAGGISGQHLAVAGGSDW
jgi:NAD(P)-dependent dehydrogenase (short-subunit alcohol dehydrogenase family)